MDSDLAGIFMFVLAAAFLVLCMAQLFHRRAVRHEERKLELKLEIERARAAQGDAMRENTALLEDRMRVLERIVTDPSADLSRQINNLRDLRSEEERA